MNGRRLLVAAGAIGLAAAVAALGLPVVQRSTAPEPGADRLGAPEPGADRSAAPATPAPGRVGVGDAPAEPSATIPQLLRTNERARITAAVAGHDPMARGTTVRLAVEVEVLPGMHVNANPPSEEWLIPVQASVASVEGIHVLEAFYPEAKSRKFPYAEEPFLVYEGTFVIGLLLSLDDGMPPGGRELEVLLDYQACNDEACFAPAATTVKLPVMVVADRADAKPVSSPLLARAPFPH